MKKEPVTPLKEKLISFETAKLAKEKGFELNSICYYQLYSEGQLRYKLFTEEDENGGYVNEDSLNRIAVVTQTLLQMWLREVHEISIKIDDYYTNSRVRFDYNVCELGSQEDNPVGIFETYEEALEIGLQEALKQIKP